MCRNRFPASAICLLLFLSSPALASLDQPDENLAWLSWRDLSEESYEQKLDVYSKKGYRPVDFEVRSVNKKRRYSLVMRKDKKSVSWMLKSRLSNSEFKSQWKSNAKKGLRPVDLETHVHKGKTYYGALWIKDGEKNWASYRDLSSKEFNKEFNENKKKKRMPVDVDAYVNKKGKLLFSGIFVKNSENVAWEIKRNIKEKDFASYFKSMADKGYRVYDLNAYEYKKQLYYAVVWVKDKESRQWASRRDMSAQGYKNWFNTYRDMGLRPEDIEVYTTQGKTRYISVWVENNKTRTRWEHRNTVNELIEDYLQDNPSEGFSLAVWHKGKLRFSRGYGLADRENNKTAHAKTVYRYASVSKAFTGTLGFILDDKNKLDLDDSIRSIIRLPKHHKYELQDLLSVRSGVCHYENEEDDVEGCSGFDGTAIDLNSKKSMMTATNLFKSEDLVASTGTLYYSTHGYTIAGAAYEKETKKPFDSLLQTYISNPLGISVRCEDRNIANSNRADIYWVDDEDSNKIKTATESSIKWKCPGGGMEGTVLDLIAFGKTLKQGSLMKKSLVEDMVTAPDSQLRGGNRYAYGWAVNMDGSDINWYAKAGDQTGGRAYIRVYQDEEIVIALLGNTRGSGYTTLTSDIAALLD